jgi:hypothetical protein
VITPIASSPPTTPGIADSKAAGDIRSVVFF